MAPFAALLASGAKLGVRDLQGHRALHVAAKYGKMRLVRMLLQKGAAAGAANDAMETPAHLSASNGHLNLTMLLLEGFERQPADRARMTPMLEAAHNNRCELLAQLLLRANASSSVDVANDLGETALHLASRVAGVRRHLAEGRR